MLPIEFFRRAATRTPDAIAVETLEGTVSYRELAVRVDALAAALQALDPAPGSRVGLLAANGEPHLTALLAILAAGKCWVPLNPRNGEAELRAMIDTTRPGIVVADAANRAKVAGAGASHLLLGEDDPDGGPCTGRLLEQFRGATPQRHYPPLDATQAIKFTSGSTGKPKGVQQPHRSWNTFTANILDAFGFDADERFLIAAPLTHGSSCFVLPVLARGGRLVLLDRPKPPDVLAAFRKRGITATYLTPTMIYMLLAEPGVRDGGYPSLRHLIYSGAPMRAAQIRAAQAVFGPCIETCYGQAEAPQMISAMRGVEFLDEARLGSVGRPCLLTGVAILGPDGGELPAGEVGEIAVRGDLIMTGYLDNPDATAAAIRDGWLRTGDLGVLDADGYLSIKGRSREVIITGGFNVYPADVEAVLGRHPAVHECTVFGVEDDKWGEAVHAAVELHAGTQAGEAALIAFVKERLDGVKAPKRIHIVPELPRSPVGKVLRREAKAMVTGGTDAR